MKAVLRGERPGRVVFFKRESGNVVSFEYDSYGRLSRELVDIDTGPAVTNEYSYSTDFPHSGKVIQHTAVSRDIETRVYADGLGRVHHSVRTATNDSGRRYVKSGMVVFDHLGRIIRQSQPDFCDDAEIDEYQAFDREKNPTVTEYDPIGRVAKVTLPPAYNGEPETSTTFEYLGAWETIETHSVGRTKRTIKNSRGQVLYVEDAGVGDDGKRVDAKIGFAYDIAGNRTKKMDLNSTGMNLSIPSSLFRPGAKDESGHNVAAWVFDAYGQLIQSSDPDLGYAGSIYDAFGQLVEKTDGLGRTTTFAYDRLGRMIRKNLPGTEGTVTYTYDRYPGSENALGRIAFIDDPSQTKKFSYDKIGRVKEETRKVKAAGEENKQYVVNYAYDLVGRKTEIAYPADPRTGTRMVTRYRHSAMGVTSVQIENGETTKNIIQSITYNELGQMSQVIRGNNSVSTYTYDAKGRLKHLLTTATHNGRTWKVQDVAYTFKVDNSISELTNTPNTAADGAFDSTIHYTYQYDGLNRLVHANGSYEKARSGQAGSTESPTTRKFERGYSYSDNGNLTSKTIYDPDSGATDERWSYSYSNHAATRIDTGSGVRFAMQYDKVGNMTSQFDAVKKLTKNMAYTSDNRIKEVRDANAKIVGLYDYDDQGFRVRKLSRQTIQGIEQFVETVSPSMYVTLEKYKSADGRDASRQSMVNHVYLNGVRVAAVMPSGKANYFLTDSVDSVTEVLNDSGVIVSQFRYLPYGEAWTEEGDKKHAPKFGSAELDKETGFIFMNYRSYDPVVSRFVKPDEVIDGQYDTQGWNRYSYVKGNPIVYKDPTGHEGSPNVLAQGLANLFGSRSGGSIADGAKTGINPPKETIASLESKIQRGTGNRVNLKEGFHVVMLENNTKAPYSTRGADELKGEYFLISDGKINGTGYGTSKASVVPESTSGYSGSSRNAGNDLLKPGSYPIHGEKGSGGMEKYDLRYMRLFKDEGQMENYYKSRGEGNHGWGSTTVPSTNNGKRGTQDQLLLHDPTGRGTNWSGGLGCQLLEGFSQASKDNYPKNADWQKQKGTYHLVDMDKLKR